MSGDLADFRGTLPPRFAHDVMRALRQTLAAGVRYGYLGTNPAVAPAQIPFRRLERCAHTRLPSRALEVELGPEYGPFVYLLPPQGHGRKSPRGLSGATLTGPDVC